MEVVCKMCGHRETINRELMVKAAGGTFVGTGFWAWVAYFFAGTGCALFLCVSIMTLGVLLVWHANFIAEWLCKRYPCPKCGSKKWEADVDVLKAIFQKKYQSEGQLIPKDPNGGAIDVDSHYVNDNNDEDQNSS